MICKLYFSFFSMDTHRYVYLHAQFQWISQVSNCLLQWDSAVIITLLSAYIGLQTLIGSRNQIFLSETSCKGGHRKSDGVWWRATGELTPVTGKGKKACPLLGSSLLLSLDPGRTHARAFTHKRGLWSGGGVLVLRTTGPESCHSSDNKPCEPCSPHPVRWLLKQTGK